MEDVDITADEDFREQAIKALMEAGLTEDEAERQIDDH